jgi:VWFA-related protein
MRKALSLLLSTLLCAAVVAQTTTPNPAKPQQQQSDDEEVVRITSELVQTDVVVTDKDDHAVGDLKLSDFEVYENGKRQELKFMEFVSVSGERRVEGARPGSGPAAAATVPESVRSVEREMTARDVRRVVAFVIDDLTIPFADVTTVRDMLRDFVDNRMEPGDLVAIIRTAGGKGLLQQFTSDKQLLRRAVAQLNVTSSYYSAFNNPEQVGITKADLQAAGAGDNEQFAAAEINNEMSKGVADETTRLTRGLIGLSTANGVIDSLRQIPGRKTLVLVSAGVPVLKSGTIDAQGVPVGVVGGASSGLYTAVNQVLNRLRDNAVRSGVVINTMDPRGLSAQRGVTGFENTPGQSALGAGNPGFGRGVSEIEQTIVGQPLSAGSEQLSLRALSDSTGGVSVINTNDFKEGLDRVLAHSRGYYVLAYTPSEKFDNKFRKLDVKVKRDGMRVFKYSGYIAREDNRAAAPRTKQEEVLAAIRSPLAKREVDVSSNLSLRMTPPKGADLGINLLIDPKTLAFAQTEGKYNTTFDVVGFIYDEVGKLRGGFSETINASLTPESYQEALKTGLTYSASTQLPPGYYQLKAVVREEGSGNLGSVSRYVEVPDLTRGRLTMSSVFLHAVDTGGAGTPVQLTALRRFPRKQDLRYSVIIYNAKLNGGKPQLLSQTLITRGNKVIFRGPEQPVVPRGTDPSQVVLVEQIGLGKASPGHYVLTLVITDPLADKKNQTLSRSIDFDLLD